MRHLYSKMAKVELRPEPGRPAGRGSAVFDLIEVSFNLAQDLR